MVLQRLKQELNDDVSKAEKYYSILSAVNGLKLTQREIELVAFTAVKGNISYANFRNEFCEKYETSSPTINNIISKLKKLKIFIKEDGKVKVNPLIVLDFKKPITLQIQLINGEAK
jgi:hypothetical protein